MSIVSTVSGLDSDNPLEEISCSNAHNNLRLRVKRSERKLAEVDMPPVITGDNSVRGRLLSASDPVRVLSIKNQIMQAATNSLEDARPDLPRTSAELEIMIEKNLKKGHEELAELNVLKKKMLISVQSQIEEAKIGSQDILEVYQGMLSSSQNLNQDEQDKNILPSLRKMRSKLKDSLKLVLDILVPNEKEVILDILSTLESAKEKNDGWVRIIDGDKVDNSLDNLQTTLISENDQSRPRFYSSRIPGLNSRVISYWSAIETLLRCYIIEQNEDDHRLFRLWIR